MNAVKELSTIISKIDNMLAQQVTCEDPQFKAWRTRAELFLSEYYGRDSIQLQKFNELIFMPFIFNDNITHYDYIQTCADSLMVAKEHFQIYLEQIEEDQKERLDVSPEKIPFNFQKVFIVHGHDGELKHAVARMIEKQDNLKAIILSEQINPGKTIIEKIEENSDVAGAICLFTADDLGRAKADTEDQSRARQNVVFEAGYFMGKLGRDHVVIICEDKVELPGDLSGVVYTKKDHWEVEMFRALKGMGYNIDMNKVFE